MPDDGSWSFSAAEADRVPQRPEAFGTRGMVASAHPVAAFIGLTILQRGGNAFDAAIAVAAAEGVVLPMKCGLGGDAFVVLHDAKKREMVAFNGSGVAAAGNGRLLPKPRPQEHAVEGRPLGQRAGRGERLRGALEALLHHALGRALGAGDTPGRGRPCDHGLHQRALRGRSRNAGALPAFRRAVSAERPRARARRALGGAESRANAEGGREGRRRGVLSRRDRGEAARVSEAGRRAVRGGRFRAAAGGHLQPDLERLPRPDRVRDRAAVAGLSACSSSSIFSKATTWAR